MVGRGRYKIGLPGKFLRTYKRGDASNAKRACFREGIALSLWSDSRMVVYCTIHARISGITVEAGERNHRALEELPHGDGTGRCSSRPQMCGAAVIAIGPLHRRAGPPVRSGAPVPFPRDGPVNSRTAGLDHKRGRSSLAAPAY
jgi:hypothetical protein